MSIAEVTGKCSVESKGGILSQLHWWQKYTALFCF